MRLIDADELRENMINVWMVGTDKDVDYVMDEVLHEIDIAPTVMVRCKECKYFEKAECIDGFLICPASGMEIHENDYCSYGERRSQDD